MEQTKKFSLLKKISYFDKGKNSESVFQAYVLGLLAIIGDDYIIKSNRESGEGRYDIMLIQKEKSKFGVIIEIKTINKKSTKSLIPQKINKILLDALNQINNNKYYKELIDNQIKPERIIKVPIVFVGKEPFIKL